MRHARAMMHVGIANLRFSLKSGAGKTFPALPAHAQPALLRIWQEAHDDDDDEDDISRFFNQRLSVTRPAVTQCTDPIISIGMVLHVCTCCTAYYSSRKYLTQQSLGVGA